MRKNKMTIAILGCIGIFLITALILVPAAQAGEKTVKLKLISPLTRIEVVPIPDVEKHAIGVLERRGVAIYENGETARPHLLCSYAHFIKKRARGALADITMSTKWLSAQILVRKHEFDLGRKPSLFRN